MLVSNYPHLIGQKIEQLRIEEHTGAKFIAIERNEDLLTSFSENEQIQDHDIVGILDTTQQIVAVEQSFKKPTKETIRPA